MKPTQLPVFSRHREQGIALIVVMVVLLLGTILVLGATRTNWLNETLVSNESDYQRALAAAEALVLDAESDIRGILPGGGNCPGCRGNGAAPTAGQPYFPFDFDDLDRTIASIGTLPIPASGALPCRLGICVPVGEAGLGNAWWDNPTRLVDMTARGATYGQHTGTDPLGTGNALLINTAARGAWYWVEIFQSAPAQTSPRGMPTPDPLKQPFFFRITAVVQGQKPGTRVVLRTIFVPRPAAAAT